MSGKLVYRVAIAVMISGVIFTSCSRDIPKDDLLQSFLIGKAKAFRVDSDDSFYITDLNMNANEWGSYSVGEMVDLDNDGEDELILDGPYGGMYLDELDSRVIVFAEGMGTASVVSYVFYDDAYWIVRSDTTHSGRIWRSLEKYNGSDCLVDSFEIYVVFDGQAYDENSQFTYRGENISMTEYEQLMAEIFG